MSCPSSAPGGTAASTAVPPTASLSWPCACSVPAGGGPWYRDNLLAPTRPADITCGQRGKGGGPTACIDVGLARWLSASRRPAGTSRGASPGGVTIGRVGLLRWRVARMPQGGGRRIHGRHRAPGLTGLVQPVPVWPASHPAQRDDGRAAWERPGGFLY